MYKKIFFFFLLSLFFSTVVHAHQPRLVHNFGNIEVNNPEVSQAFYGELVGDPVLYKIESKEPFTLYISILVPDVTYIDKDISAYVYKKNESKKELIATLDGLNYKWSGFYEEFAGDNYFQGPEFKSEDLIGLYKKGKEVEAGTYIIEIFSPDNLGKYVFVVGEKEEFPISEIVNVFKTLPELKVEFFGKSIFTIFFNRIGLFLFIFFVFSISIYFLLKLKFFPKKKV